MILLSVLKEHCRHESKRFGKMQIVSVALGPRIRNLN